MLFSRHPSHLVVLNSESITVYPNVASSPIGRQFSPTVLKHQELLDPQEFQTSLVSFFSEEKLSGETLIVLENDIVYQKQFSPPVSNKEDSKISDFLETIPFDKEKIAYRVVTNGAISVIYAINRELVVSICLALKTVGGKCSAVVPMSLYGIDSRQSLSRKDILDILQNKHIPKIAEMINLESNKSYFLGIIFVAFVIIVVCSILAMVGIKLFFSF